MRVWMCLSGCMCMCAFVYMYACACVRAHVGMRVCVPAFLSSYMWQRMELVYVYVHAHKFLHLQLLSEDQPGGNSKTQLFLALAGAP